MAAEPTPPPTTADPPPGKPAPADQPSDEAAAPTVALGGSALRYALSAVLLLFSGWAGAHFARLYAGRRLWLGLLCSLVLLAILLCGVLSFALARRRLGRELRAFAAPTPPPDSLLGRRREELLALRARGGRPDMAALSGRAAAGVVSQAYLGRYFVTVAVLVGLLGTFAGLMETLSSVSTLLREDTGQTIQSVLLLLSAPLSGLDVTFGASMVGILTTVTLALLQGDLGLSEEHLLAELEAHTAHVLVPSLWPREQEPGVLALREVTALRGDLAALLAQMAATQAAGQAGLHRVGEAVAQAAATQAVEGQRLLAAHAERTAEALLHHENQLMDQLDTRVRQSNEALSVQARRLAGIVEQAVQQIGEQAGAHEAAREAALRQLLAGVDEAVQRTVRAAGEHVAAGSEAASQASLRSAEASTQASLRSAEAAAQASQRGAEAVSERAAALLAALEVRGQDLLGALAAQAGQSAAAASAQAAAAATQAAAHAAAAAEGTRDAATETLAQAGRQVAETMTAVTAAVTDASSRAAAAAEDAGARAATAAETATSRAAAAAENTAAAATAAVTDAASRAAAAAEDAGARAAASAASAAHAATEATGAVRTRAEVDAREIAAQLHRYAAALTEAEAARTQAFTEGEARRGADHEALRQRLVAFLEDGVAAGFADHLAAWQVAAQAVQAASAEISRGAAAVQEGAARFCAGADGLAPPLGALGPELHALSAEVALWVSHSGPEAALPPQLLAELMRLTDGVERLAQRLEDGPLDGGRDAAADHGRPAEAG